MGVLPCAQSFLTAAAGLDAIPGRGCPLATPQTRARGTASPHRADQTVNDTAACGLLLVLLNKNTKSRGPGALSRTSPPCLHRSGLGLRLQPGRGGPGPSSLIFPPLSSAQDSSPPRSWAELPGAAPGRATPALTLARRPLPSHAISCAPCLLPGSTPSLGAIGAAACGGSGR